MIGPWKSGKFMHLSQTSARTHIGSVKSSSNVPPLTPELWIPQPSWPLSSLGFSRPGSKTEDLLLYRTRPSGQWLGL